MPIVSATDNMNPSLMRQYVDLIFETSAPAIIGSYKLISYDPATRIAKLEGHDDIKLADTCEDHIKPGYNYAFEMSNGQAIRVILMVVDTVIYTDEEVLMIKRKNPPFAGHWALPGGFIDPGETPKQAAMRELVEETGLEVSALDFVGEYKTPRRDPRMEHVWSYAFSLHVAAKESVKAGDDASRAEWIPIKQLNKIQLAFDHADIIKQALGA
jgi:8-oxo-dGTP diphosphatase